MKIEDLKDKIEISLDIHKAFEDDLRKQRKEIEAAYKIAKCISKLDSCPWCGYNFAEKKIKDDCEVCNALEDLQDYLTSLP